MILYNLEYTEKQYNLLLFRNDGPTDPIDEPTDQRVEWRDSKLAKGYFAHQSIGAHRGNMKEIICAHCMWGLIFFLFNKRHIEKHVISPF